MRALGVGVVSESRLPSICPGDIVYGWTGWQDYCCLDASGVLTHVRDPDIAVSSYAGILGINGMTAWLALERLGRPKTGETVLVSTAAGAVGRVVAHLARAEGCRTLGLTGSAAKAVLVVGRFDSDVASP